MKLNFGRERKTFPITAGRPGIILIVTVLLVLCLADRSSAYAITLTEMARALVSDNTVGAKVPAVFRGYSSLGLRKEAASYLERNIQLAEISRAEAAPLFEEIVKDQSRYENPGELIAICETAIRNGASTPLVLYSYGMALWQAGRLGEASAIFARVPKASGYSLYALFAIGQIAAEEGRAETAGNVFNRVREATRERGVNDILRKRATRSQAELLLTVPPQKWGRSPGRDRSSGGRQRCAVWQQQGIAGDCREMAGQESDPPVLVAGGSCPGGWTL